MTLQACCCFSPSSPLPASHPPKHHHCCFLFPTKYSHPTSFSSFHLFKNLVAAAKDSVSSSEGGKLVSELLDDELLGQVSAAKDAGDVLALIAEENRKNWGVVSASDCHLILSAALDRGNAELALSVFSSMRSSFDSGARWGENATSVERWRWSRPDLITYASLVKGLAALRVSDALRIIECVCRVRVSPGEEVSFGMVVRCPTCMIAAAVAQPQHGIQIVSCSKCRYQYELVSGNILTIESEEIGYQS